jgi:hypothetical protein
MKTIVCLMIIVCILSSYSTITTAEFSISRQDPVSVEKPEINEPTISLDEYSLKVLVTSAVEYASVSISNNE